MKRLLGFQGNYEDWLHLGITCKSVGNAGTCVSFPRHFDSTSLEGGLGVEIKFPPVTLTKGEKLLFSKLQWDRLNRNFSLVERPSSHLWPHQVPEMESRHPSSSKGPWAPTATSWGEIRPSSSLTRLPCKLRAAMWELRLPHQWAGRP